MAKLLYSAIAPDGSPTEGFVNAPSVVSAREQLERQGLKKVVLHQEPTVAKDRTELDGLTPDQQRALARFKLKLMQSPSLTTVLLEQVQRMRVLLALAAVVGLYGVVQARWLWAAVGLVAGVAPLAWTAWNFRHADRYDRLLRHSAVGNWDAVRVLARDLRAISGGKPMVDFDLDVRLACIYARDHSLPEALARLESWRARWQTRPGLFEARVASVYMAAGDTAGYVAQMARAHELHSADPARQADHALAKAKFGDVEQADELLKGVDPQLLPPHGQGFLKWARGVVQMRRGAADAEPLLADAVTSLLQLSEQPAVWTALALCACDHAIALHQAGRHDAARTRIAEVWPVLEVHATVPLLRMLEADDLLPVRRTLNT
jgi:hypothetical protein